jgi:tetratricopeptide (TPR) repeat protein
MASRRLPALFLPLLLVCSAAAQFQTGTLKVRVTFLDGRPCTLQLRVQLMSSASTTPVAEGYTNDAGMVQFNNVEVADYHVVISGEGIVETDSGMFEVDNRRGSQYLYVSVKRTADASQANANWPGSALVAAVDLNIPASAAKQFDKATALMAKQEWKKAVARLRQALALYPRYAGAYNNLGVAYANLGDRASERAALQKAVDVNDHFAPAYVNLARMAIVDRDFPTAETLLNRASAIDPSDLQTLLLLSNVELLNKHYELAIANCRKMHSSSQTPHALVHYIAARAYEHEGRPLEAAAEFRTFLQEEPSGERAEAVRKELASLRNPVR